jgi:hypothetical protein
MKIKMTLLLVLTGLIASCTNINNQSSNGSNQNLTSSETGVQIPLIPEYNHPANQIVINRDSWPLLSHYPNDPTQILFRNAAFTYFAASNENDNSITGKGNEFFIYNQDALAMITKIELHLVRPKIGSDPESFSFHVSPTNAYPKSPSEKLTPNKISPILYELDLNGLNIRFFSLINLIYKIEIRELIIHISDDSSLPNSRPNPEFVDDPSSLGFYQLTTPTITRNDFKNVTGSPLDGASFPNIGSPKVLIVPINFQDFGCVGVVACGERETEIYNAFLGEASDTGYESVKSYYYKSSYGKLDIQGVVTPTYNVGLTADAWARQTTQQPTWSPSEYEALPPG